MGKPLTAEVLRARRRYASRDWSTDQLAWWVSQLEQLHQDAKEAMGETLALWSDAVDALCARLSAEPAKEHIVKTCPRPEPTKGEE